jgi:hypothetical protein
VLVLCAGHFVSGFVKKQLPMLLVGQMGGGKSSVQDALHASFLEVDENLEASTIDCEFSGCTCAVVHLQVRAAQLEQRTLWLEPESWALSLVGAVCCVCSADGAAAS